MEREREGFVFVREVRAERTRVEELGWKCFAVVAM